MRQLTRPLAWSLPKLEKRLTEVRDRGYEIQTSAKTAGVTDISFPIFGFNGHVIAALTVPYLTLIDDSAPTTLEQTRKRLGIAARKVSEGLGFNQSSRRRSPGTTLAL